MSEIQVRRSHASLDLNKISHFLLTLFVFLMLFIGISLSRRSAVRYAEEMHQKKVTSMAQQVSDAVMNYTHICDAIAASDNVLRCATTSYNTKGLANLIQIEMANMISVSPVDRSQIALFFLNTPIIITPSQYYVNPDYSTFFSHWYGDALTMENLVDQLKLDKKSWYTYCVDNAGYLVRTVNVEGVPVAFIVLGLDFSKMLSVEEGMLVFIGSDTDCIYSNLSGITKEQYRTVLDSITNGRRFVIDRKTYTTTQNVFSNVDLNILVGVPLTVISREIWFNVLWIAGTVCLVLLSIFVLHKFLEDKYFNEPAGNAELFRRLSPLELGLLLQSILEKPDADTSLFQRCLAAAEIPVNSDYFIIGFSYLEDSEGLFKALESGNGKSAELPSPYFVLNNVLQDLLFENHPGSLCIVKNYYIALVGRSELEQAEDIREIIDQLTAFFHNYLAISIAATQPMLTSAARLKTDVEAILDEISHHTFWHYTKKSEAPGNTENSTVFYKLMEKMRDCFENEKYNEASDIFDEIIEKHLPTNVRDIHIAKSRLYSIFDMLVSVTGIQTDTLDLKWMDLNNVIDFRDAGKKVFNELIHRPKPDTANINTQNHINNVREYVLVHLADTSLSVSVIAEHFDLNVTYLSRIFKENTGINLLEYIQRVRVNMAKELLHTHSVKETASEVGFVEMQTFVRVFKKYEGITPAKFKSLVSQEQA